MRMSRIIAPLAIALGMQGLHAPQAAAQLGLYTLPKDDFVWHWGDLNLERRRAGVPDIEVSGSEALFQCDLTARMRPSTSLSPAQIRDIEHSLRTRLDFIYAVSEAMNYLEFQRALDWATLDCKKHEPEPASAEQRAEREAAAREKMLRELERRRERAQRGRN
jgi:hypothetical protein